MNEIPGVIVTRLTGHRDDRGTFAEIVRAPDLPVGLVQASHSRSKAGVLRGLHFHRVQADLWYLVRGRAQIALADLRQGDRAPAVMTFTLDADAPTTVFIPSGVAHGYLALTDIDMLYWTSELWDPSDEHGLAWDDATLRIPWERSDPILSERDRNNPALVWDEIPEF